MGSVETREKFLDAREALLLTDGYLRTSIDAVCERAGRTKGQAATIAAIQNHPTLGGVHFQAKTRWTGATLTRTTCTGVEAAGSIHPRSAPHITRTDMPIPFHGTDTAPAPTDRDRTPRPRGLHD